MLVQPTKGLKMIRYLLHPRVPSKKSDFLVRSKDEPELRPDTHSPQFPQALEFIKQWNDTIDHTARELTSNKLKVCVPALTIW